jgi:hypothetical protein
MQYLHPFYYNFHKAISNILGLIIMVGFLQPLQLPHVGIVIDAGFLQPLQYPHVGP